MYSLLDKKVSKATKGCKSKTFTLGVNGSFPYIYINWDKQHWSNEKIIKKSADDHPK